MTSFSFSKMPMSDHNEAFLLYEAALKPIIFDEFRNKKYGNKIMEILQQRASGKSIKVTLSSFKNNTGAIRFYKTMGYRIVAEDAYFYDMILGAE